MYNLIIHIYQLAVRIYARFNSKACTMWKGERAAIATLREKMESGAKYIWFHAASLGEFEQGRPLMEHARRALPQYKILLTFFSPSGYEVRKDYEGADIITYLPLDTRRNARRFLRTVRPVAAFFIKYEFWYNYLHILKHRRIPVFSVSSIFRPDQIFFRWYGKQYAYVLRCFTHFFVQNDESRHLLAKIGIRDNVSVTGDTRFDRVLTVQQSAKALPVVEQFCRTQQPDAPHVFIAGSSWQPDEDIFIRYLRERNLLDTQQWKLIIAPHVIDNAHLNEIEQKLQGLRVVRYTQADDDTDLDNTHVLIVDCFGLLSAIYRYATVTYVGGGFGEGIHNLLEAAVWGKPVLFGPNNRKFQEAQDLKANGGGIEIADDAAFANTMDQLLANPQQISDAGDKAHHYVKANAQVTTNILNILHSQYGHLL